MSLYHIFLVTTILPDLHSISIASRAWMRAGPIYQHFTTFAFSLFRPFILRYPGLRNGNELCGGVPYHISYGKLSLGCAEVSVQINALHAQLPFSAHRLSPFGEALFGYSSNVCVLAVRPAASIIAIWRLATPFSSGVPAVASSCLIFSRVHSSNSYPQPLPPPSLLINFTLRGTMSSKFFVKYSAVSSLLRRKFTLVSPK